MKGLKIFNSLYLIQRLKNCVWLWPGIFVFYVIIPSEAQNLELKLGKEYLYNGEYAKAYEIYSKLSKKNENIPLIYNDYKSVLLAMKDEENLQVFLKKATKQYPENFIFKLDYFLSLDLHKRKEEAQKEFKLISNYIKKDFNQGKLVGDFLIKNSKLSEAMEVYLIARKASGDKYFLISEIALLLKFSNKNQELIEELLSFLKDNPAQIELVKNTFQSLLSEKKEFEDLEVILYSKIQKEPEEITLNELVLWINIQKREFAKAFIQAKAIDKRTKSEGSKLLEVGKIAFDNKDFESSSRYFETIIRENKNSRNYAIARRLLILSKEEVIKTTFPVDNNQIESLIKDYDGLINELGKNSTTQDAMRSKALLYAFYLNKKDSAINILNEAINQSRSDEMFKAKLKLDLGDIYLLNSEPWEATLLYSQVEKSQRDEVLGHEAKLRNAKLSYYKGDFVLAQDHLDVLKLATSREIANDAMKLSILIQDNLAFDTTGKALREFSQVDLLIFQNKYEEALKILEQMELNYPEHSLADDILFQKAIIFKTIGKYEEAIISLNKLLELYSEDILGDDSMILLGDIYENNLNNKEKAKEIYQNFLFKYPGSIFNVEARKRFRLLRGDKI